MKFSLYIKLEPGANAVSRRDHGKHDYALCIKYLSFVCLVDETKFVLIMGCDADCYISISWNPCDCSMLLQFYRWFYRMCLYIKAKPVPSSSTDFKWKFPPLNLTMVRMKISAIRIHSIIFIIMDMRGLFNLQIFAKSVSRLWYR